MEIAGKTFCFRGPFPGDPGPVKFELVKLRGRVTEDVNDAKVEVVVVDDAGGKDAELARARGRSVVSLRAVVDFLVTVAPPHRVANLGRALRVTVGPDSPARLADALHEAAPSNGTALVELLRQALENGVNVELGEGEPCGEKREDAWLLAWCSDADGCSFFAVPGADVERAGLREIRGACFADGRDVERETLGVLIRVLAGMQFVGSRDPDELARSHFAGWHDEFVGAEAEVGLSSADELVPWIGWLAPFRLTTFSQVERAFAGIVAVNQAM